MTIAELKIEIHAKSYEESVEILTAYIKAHPREDGAYTLRGMRHWGAGHRSLAINDYLAAIAINSDSPARAALEAADSILAYRNKDLYNP